MNFRTNLFKLAMTLVASFLVSLQSSLAQSDLTWPGEKSVWSGYAKFDFKVDGRSAYIVKPKTPAPGNPWVWRARFPNFHAEADLILLKRGFHIARIDTDGMLGSPKAIKHWDAFYQFLTGEGLAERCCLEGVSRGGLFVYRFASNWPERVACIYCDTPVCDIRSWPGGKGTGRGHDATWKTCLAEYGLNESTAETFKDNPLDRLAPIAKNEIPILHIVSMNDAIVPPSENTLVLAERYKELGGTIDVIQVEEGSEKSGGHHFKHPDPIRVADFIELHSSVFPTADEYFQLRGSLNNSRLKFLKTGKGKVVFLGGSITTMKGWRDLAADYLREKFPDTEFEFVDAGISSTGSTPGAFRLMRDVFANGGVDILFEEAAVNDLHNMRTSTEATRGMEGIIRQARNENPNIDIVVMHFADVPHLKSYRSGSVPMVIARHEAVAKHYNVPSINLAKQITDQIDTGMFDWKNDFKNCHPSPFGHQIYAAAIRRMFAKAWEKPRMDRASPMAHALPDPMDAFSYDKAKIVSLDQAKNLVGFVIDTKCDPRLNEVGGSVRDRFHNVPMLIATQPASEFSFDFAGRAVGLFVAAGPDAGVIQYSIDNGPWKSKDLFTKWSKRLHIPWVYVLENELDGKSHQLRVRVATRSNEASKGNACRIVNLLVNE